MRFIIPLTVIVAAAMANAAALEGRATKCTAKSAEALLKKNKGQKFCKSYLAKTVTVYETATVQATGAAQTQVVTSTPYTTVTTAVSGVKTSTSVVPLSFVSTTTLKNPSFASQANARMAEKTATPTYLKGCKASAIRAACGDLVKKPKAKTVTQTITATNTAAGSTQTVQTVGPTGTITSTSTNYATSTVYSVSVTSAAATSTASIYLGWKAGGVLGQLYLPSDGTAAAVAAVGKASTSFTFTPWSSNGGNPSSHGLVSGYFTTTVGGSNYCVKITAGAPKLDATCYTSGSPVVDINYVVSINPNFNYVYSGQAGTTGGTLTTWDSAALKWVSTAPSATVVDLYINNTAQFTA